MDQVFWRADWWNSWRKTCKNYRDRWNAYLYRFKKKYFWIWIAVDRDAKKFIHCTLGNRGSITGKKLWESIKDLAIESVCTDYWSAYGECIPPDQHIQSKAETYTVEGYNSFFRHFLARLRRKTKCYSKSPQMLEYSVKLLMLKWNNRLPILN
jgi:insertion element IS1 protein InsB